MNPINGVAKYEPATLVAVTGSYAEMPSFQTDSPLVDFQQTTFLASVDRDLADLMSKLSHIQYVKRHSDQYSLSKRQQERLKISETNVLAKIDQTVAVGRACHHQVESCSKYPLLNITDFWVPNMKPLNGEQQVCSQLKGDNRFRPFSGGCMDIETGYVWSAPSQVFWTFSQAKDYCARLPSGGVSTWSLASIFDLSGLAGEDGAAAGLKDGNLLNDFFWSFDPSNKNEPVRVNILTGAHKSGENPGLTFRVLCKQGGATVVQ